MKTVARLSEAGQAANGREMKRNIVNDFRRQFREHIDVGKAQLAGFSTDLVVCPRQRNSE